MTDRSYEPTRGRIDLRAIDGPSDPLQAQRVITAAMSRRTRDRESRGDVLASISTFARPLIATAAVLLLVAMATLLITHGRGLADQPASMLASWAEASHVPTNGELLATFQGYDR